MLGSSLGVPCRAPAALSPAAPGISTHSREIKESESEALECLAASQLSREEVISIVVSLSLPHSRNQQLLYASTFLPARRLLGYIRKHRTLIT